MFNFDKRNATHIAQNMRASFSAFDETLLTSSELMSSLLRGKKSADLPEVLNQKILVAIHQSAADVLSGREKAIQAARLLTRIHKASHQAETDFGCPGPGPWSKSRSATLAVVAG